MEITGDILKEIAPNARIEVLDAFAETMTELFEQYKITTPLRAAHFLAQAAHECGGFTVFAENLNYSAKRLTEVFPKYFRDANPNAYARKPEKIANRVYANRMGNGDEDSGDGYKYRGRGIFQLTGKANYKTIGDAIEVDLVDDPDAALSSDVAVQVALEYWSKRGLNALADKDDIVGITKKINGGTNGLEDRKDYLEKAKEALGI
jgi:putative chitinase